MVQYFTILKLRRMRNQPQNGTPRSGDRPTQTAFLNQQLPHDQRNQIRGGTNQTIIIDDVMNG